MTDYRGLASYAPTEVFGGVPGNNYTMGHEFYVTASSWLRGLWFYRGSTSIGATPTGAIYTVDANGLNGATVKNTTVAFNAGATTGWIYQALPSGPVGLVTNQRYRVGIYYGSGGYWQTSNFWSSGPGASGLTTGPLVFPSQAAANGNMQGSFYNPAGVPNSPETVTFPGAGSPQNFGVDVTVTDVSYPVIQNSPKHLSNNATWTNTIDTPINATALENIESVADRQSPFSGFSTNKIFTDKREALATAALSETTLFYQQGPGVVKSIFMSLGGGAGATKDGRLRIYYDGSATPVMDMDIGTLFSTHYAAGNINRNHRASHMSIQQNDGTANVGFTMTFVMPFGVSMRIAYYNAKASGTALVNSMISYILTDTDRANGLRLRCQGANVTAPLVVAAANPVPLASMTGNGWIVWLALTGGLTATNFTWMERNVTLQIDGESVPGASIVSTGVDHFFDSAWYFEAQTDVSLSTHSYTGYYGPGSGGADANLKYAVGIAVDLLSKWGGIPFTTSAIFTMQPEPACTALSSYFSAVLYYN